MAITIGDMLGGIGAAFGGTAQQYAQGLRQREQGITEQKRAELQARQRAMYQDANAAFQLLQQGDLDGIIRLADDGWNCFRHSLTQTHQTPCVFAILP